MTDQSCFNTKRLPEKTPVEKAVKQTAQQLEKEIAQKIAPELVGTTIIRIAVDDTSLRLELNDGSTIEAKACSGPGADSNWYTWTIISINGHRLVDE